MASSPDLQTTDSSTSHNNLSEAEKLRRRRAARNKRILASGTDRLNRIVGLSSSQTDSSNRDGGTDNIEISNISPTNSSLNIPEKKLQAPSEPNETSTLSSASTLNENLKSNSSATTIENYSSASLNDNEAKSSALTDSINEKNFQERSNLADVSSSQDFDTIKRTTSRVTPNDSLKYRARSMDSNNPILKEILSSANSSNTLSRDPFINDQPNPQEINEIIANVLPSFLAQHASGAVLTSNPTFSNSSGNFKPETPRTVDSGLSLDNGIGRVFRIAFFTILVLFLLFISFSPSEDMDTVLISDYQQEGYVLSVPYIGDLKPIHILLAVEVLIQTYRYFQAQRAPPRRMGPSPIGLPGFLGKAYQLYNYYSDSWNSLADDLCFGIFFLGIGTFIFSIFYD